MQHSIVHRLDAVARQAPDRPAFLWRESRWTYATLRLGIGAVCASLRASSLAPGERVALLIRNSPQYAAVYYGVLAARAVAVPLNAQERAAVLARQIAHCNARVLFGDPEHPEWTALLQAIAGSDVRVIPISLREPDASFAHFIAGLAAPEDPPFAEVSPQDLATIIYTSGTTGHPKGVMLSHGNLASNAAAIIDYLALKPSDRGLCVLPFHFSYGGSVLHTHLLSGALLVVEDNFAFPHLIAQRLQSEAITGIAGVPSTFALLLGRCRLQDFDLSALRYMTQAGGAMPRALIERLVAQLPHTRLFVMYGQTEATARLSYLPPAKLDSKAGSVGIPVAGVELQIRTEGRILGAGEVGEICARGPNVMLGYWNDDAATAEVLRDGWLHTGDLGHRDDEGYFFIDGRAVDMIKVGAFRVSPQEVEEAIAALAGVEEVAVFGIADEVLGQAIKAMIVLRPGASVEARAVKAHCRAQLATYKVPKVVEFAGVLPRTSSGKIQRYKLA